MIRPGNSIALTFTLVVSICTTLIFSIAIGYFYYQSRVMLERELEQNAANLVQSSINRLETTLHSIDQMSEDLALSLATGQYSQSNLLDLLRKALHSKPGIHGIGVAFAPESSVPPITPQMPYFFRQGRQLIYEPDANFDYTNRDWYQIPKELGKKHWSEPYRSEINYTTLLTTCSVPIFKGEGADRHIWAMMVVDVSLESLTRLVASIRVLESGYGFLLSPNGTYLTHPDRQLIMHETIFSRAESRNKPELRVMGRNMLRGESHFVEHINYRNHRTWIYYAPIRSIGWTLAVVFPEEELYADVHTLTLSVIAIALAGIAFLTFAVHAISRRITAPLIELTQVSSKIAAGNFSIELPAVRGHDEVGRLTMAFASMICDLKAYIRDLTETMIAKERIQTELKMATHIQSSLLPRLFPPFPDRPELDIYASMDPAKEVGGDFYDFFLVDEQHLCFLVADVADKGVPAALYMMVAKTLLKAECQRWAMPEPDRILTEVNAILAVDNDNCMFITVFCAILNTSSGELCFANAGHNPPLLVRNAQARHVPVQAGLVLGVLPDADYTVERLWLEPGDVFFLYTDGITEAVNPLGELYGEERLRLAMEQAAHQGLEEMNHSIRNDIVLYAEGAPQADDITMIAIRYKGQQAP